MMPRATMRLQFHKGFTFADARAQIGYFKRLGISHVYASPILTARPGSLHGYDVIDPTRVNPELGGEDGLRDLVAALRRACLGLIVDIVPNHMAVGAGNAWWWDVLQSGRTSRHAHFFDIDWEPDDPELHGKVLAPVLGRSCTEALAAGEVTLVPTGLVIEVPTGMFLGVFARSSTPLKRGLMVANGVGVVDSDYCGPNDEIKVPVINVTNQPVCISAGDRIAQGILLPAPRVQWEEVEEVVAASRGGFGSTGGK